MKNLRQYRIKILSVAVLSLILITSVMAASPISSADKLVKDAKKQIGVTTSYDPAYRKLDFPRGDVPQNTGVCTDVVIRAYRLQNIDLQ